MSDSLVRRLWRWSHWKLEQPGLGYPTQTVEGRLMDWGPEGLAAIRGSRSPGTAPATDRETDSEAARTEIAVSLVGRARVDHKRALDARYCGQIGERRSTINPHRLTQTELAACFGLSRPDWYRLLDSAHAAVEAVILLIDETEDTHNG